MGLSGFMRLPNLAPHAFRDYDPSRHCTWEDLFFILRYLLN